MKKLDWVFYIIGCIGFVFVADILGDSDRWFIAGILIIIWSILWLIPSDDDRWIDDLEDDE